MGATYQVEAPVLKARSATWLSIGGSYDSAKAVAGMGATLEAIGRTRRGELTDEELQQ